MGRLNLERSKQFLDFNNSNFQVIILFASIFITCLYIDLVFSDSNLLIPFVITTLLSSFISVLGIPQLQKIKIKQIIRKEGPKSHLSKAGTPTMGGIFIISTGLIIGNILSFNKDDYNLILTLSFLVLFFMCIGLIDDFLSLKKKLNTGLKSNEKIVLQTVIGTIFLLICFLNNYIPNTLKIAQHEINIGYLIYPLGLFVLLAESNSTNLTDGLDGLLSGCSILMFTGLSIEILLESQGKSQSLSHLCIVLAGSCMGFLFLNKNPAKIFMGDSGSLAIGASLGGIALISNNLLSLFIMGGVLVAESMSVIIQVSIFKISKRLRGKGQKIFLMTPIHHHFELQGKNEVLIVGSFWLVTLLLIIINLIFL